MTDDHFRVHGVQADDLYTLTCSGFLDAAAVPTMRAATLQALASRCEVIVLDVRGVPFMDSAGLTSIRLARKAAEIAGVELRLLNASSALANVLRLADAEYLVERVANVRL